LEQEALTDTKEVVETPKQRVSLSYRMDAKKKEILGDNEALDQAADQIRWVISQNLLRTHVITCIKLPVGHNFYREAVQLVPFLVKELIRRVVDREHTLHVDDILVIKDNHHFQSIETDDVMVRVAFGFRDTEEADKE
jgi:hypothetical protein